MPRSIQLVKTFSSQVLRSSAYEGGKMFYLWHYLACRQTDRRADRQAKSSIWKILIADESSVLLFLWQCFRLQPGTDDQHGNITQDYKHVHHADI